MTYELTIEEQRSAVQSKLGFHSLRKQLGQVATRCQLAQTFSSNKNLMSRTYRHMRADVQRFKIVVSAGHTDASNSFAETPLGADPTVTASVEYPLGTHTRVTWGGAAKGIIPDLGHLVSDWIEVPIAANQKFGVDLWLDNASGDGIAYNSAKLAPDMGDLFARATSTADATMGAAFTGTSITESYFPSAIIAMTETASVIIFGDSIAFGVSPEVAEAATDGVTGLIERSIGLDLPYINCGRAGDWGWYFQQSHDWRMSLADYCSSAIYQYGINDVSNSRGAANIAADRQAFSTFLPDGMPAFVTTILPQTTSTDAWATTANQTTTSGAKETARVTENTARKASPAGFAGVFDTEAAVLSGLASGLWIVNGSANYSTTDGTHPTKATNLLVRASGAVSVAALAAKTERRTTQRKRFNRRAVYRRAASLSLKPSQSQQLISNAGATALVMITLPSPTEGLEFEFLVADADGIKVQVATGATAIASRIYFGGGVSADGGFIQSTTIGSTLKLVCHNTSWFVTASGGTWAVT